MVTIESFAIVTCAYLATIVFLVLAFMIHCSQSIRVQARMIEEILRKGGIADSDSVPSLKTDSAVPILDDISPASWVSKMLTPKTVEREMKIEAKSRGVRKVYGMFGGSRIENAGELRENENGWHK